MNSTPISDQNNENSLLLGSKTLKNLREILFTQAVLVMKYQYFSTVADFEGMNSFSHLLREIAESDAQIVQGCMDFLREVDEYGEEVRGGNEFKSGGTLKNFNYLALEWEKLRNSCQKMKETARREGFEDIVSWFETLEKMGHWRLQQLKRVNHGIESTGN